MVEPVEIVIVRGQQKFEIESKLNPVEIEVNNGRVLNILKKYENVYYELTPLGILFPSSVTNDIKQILVTCRELSDTKKLLIKGKIYSLMGIIDLQKINGWKNIYEKSLWVNATFNKQEEINNSRYLCFPVITSSLNGLLNFSINLIDHKNQQISFKSDETKK